MSRKCRFCDEELSDCFANLGLSPIANAYVKESDLDKGEMYFPLYAYVCQRCFLVQLTVFETPENIFTNYAYFSSYSNTWLEHCKSYSENVIERFHLGNEHRVIEIASNDGYMLQYFKDRGLSVLGIEPAVNVAQEAIRKGIETLCEFFGKECSEKLVKNNLKADLVIANNVLAHVPDINGVIGGVKEILNTDGVFTAEFPHLLKLIKDRQFDTIYHEHFSYFSFITMNQIIEKHKLKIFDVETLMTHGGSLRIYVTHEDNEIDISERVLRLHATEIKHGMTSLAFYKSYNLDIQKLKREILATLIQLKSTGKTIVGYGAPAKGNTMLNYCGIGPDIIDYTVDLNPYKQGMYLPGSRIKVYSVDKIIETKPDYIIILPWNLMDEVSTQIEYVREWDGKFITLIPTIQIW